ncbi:S-layer homology domain-containing protein [Paenibacillus dendritiformis]|uniref:S-layer homology domain-containing protein n=1 Tax=Paenibacillus dendritiformis TaxID=130049 RepID=UPI00143CD812|nr:S-layer homology domain-containing protein [Paenibacillus dendritiformis]NKI20955.1 S-layer homology domain-containing protein [Paenibacillus dendritiformis]NRF97808.1 S-layer homology domain-containing protein [Paenibacillus dendritiformis]
MREMSYQSSKQDSQQTKQFRGGDKKVMKKRLALLLSVAMAFSMFANVAFGAEAAKTTQEKFNALKEAGIFAGFPGTDDAKLEQNTTRAEFARVVVKALGLKEVEGVYSYKDKNYGPKHWAAKYIEAVTAEGLMQGINASKQLFGTNDNITVQEAAKVLVLGYKYDIPENAENSASDWAKKYFQAAVDAGLFSKDANPKANATRGQLVEAVYAADEAAKGPKVESAKVIDAKNVEVTMSDKEVVKVELKEELKANEEREIKFEYKGKEYTTKVTYVVTSAQKIESVTAENLKEVVVTFDGTVDVKSAEKADNYDIKDMKIDSVKLAADKKSATILLKEEDSSTMKNQKEIELKVKGVQNEDKSKTFDQKIKFTPVDVKTPEVKEVVGLGTKAFKVVFSEPVKKTGVYTTSNYKVDGKTVSASVQYVYPNVAIVKTDLSVGEHKLTVSNVEDFSGLKIAPVDSTFTVAEDTTAPEVVSAKAKDPTELEIEFNETVKSVGKIYHGNSSNTGVVEIKDNVVTVKFTKEKALYLGENTVYIEGVTDYSDNKANRDVKVNPSLDAERPEVEKVELKNNEHKLIVTFNKELNESSAVNRDNYVLKNKDGKVFKHPGLNSDGKPFKAPTLDSTKKKVTIDLIERLDAGDYTLEINNVRDNAYVNNTMLPYSKVINADETTSGIRAWATQDSYQDHLFIQFPKAVKTDGEGDATVKEKYTFADKTLGDSFESPVLAQPDTIRIDAKRGTLFNENGSMKTGAVTVSYVKDTNGDWLKENDSFTLKVGQLGEAKVTFNQESAELVSREEVKVKMSGKLNYVYAKDFEVITADGGKYEPSSATMDGLTLTLKFEDRKLPVDMYGATLYVVGENSQDTFGNPIKKPAQIKIKSDIKPEVTSIRIVKSPLSATEATYAAVLTVDSQVTGGAYLGEGKEHFTVWVGGEKASIVKVTNFEGTDLGKVDGNGNKVTTTAVYVNFTTNEKVDTNTRFVVKFVDAGDIPVLVDRDGRNVKGFELYGYYQ